MIDDKNWNIKGELNFFACTLPKEMDEAWVVPLSDVHFGNQFFSPKHFQRTVDVIKENPRIYTVLNGDLCDAVIKDSLGDIYHQVHTPQDQRDWIIAQLLPIRSKILGMTTGNHEERIARRVGVDISKDIAEALNIPYRPDGLLLKISLGQGNSRHPDKPYIYWGYFTHGYGGARTKGAKNAKVERTAAYIHADFYVMSHDHDVNVTPAVYLLPDNRTHTDPDTGFIVGRVVAHRKMLIKSNAYMKWGGYGERGGFAPVDLEAPIIKLFANGMKRVRVEV